jgi:hypothetical protein
VKTEDLFRVRFDLTLQPIQFVDLANRPSVETDLAHLAPDCRFGPAADTDPGWFGQRWRIAATAPTFRRPTFVTVQIAS